MTNEELVLKEFEENRKPSDVGTRMTALMLAKILDIIEKLASNYGI